MAITSAKTTSPCVVLTSTTMAMSSANTLVAITSATLAIPSANQIIHVAITSATNVNSNCK